MEELDFHLKGLFEEPERLPDYFQSITMEGQPADTIVGPHWNQQFDIQLTNPNNVTRLMHRLMVQQRCLPGDPDYEGKLPEIEQETVSRHIQARLCKGEGGKIVMGVDEENFVRGILLTKCQKDHVFFQLERIKSTFLPKIPEHLISLKFLPVVDQYTAKHIFAAVNYLPHNTERPHSIFYPDTVCWCTKGKYLLRHQQRFIIQICLAPWVFNDPRNFKYLSLPLLIPPAFCNEEGRQFMYLGSKLTEKGVMPLSTSQQVDLANYLSEAKRIIRAEIVDL